MFSNTNISEMSDTEATENIIDDSEPQALDAENDLTEEEIEAESKPKDWEKREGTTIRIQEENNELIKLEPDDDLPEDNKDEGNEGKGRVYTVGMFTTLAKHDN